MQVEIAPASDGQHIPTCTPSLMPFHISYTGPAPVSRYFRPKPAPPPSTTLSVRSSSSATLVASSSSSSVLSDTNARGSLMAVSSTTSIETLTPDNERGDNASSVATPDINVTVDHQVAQTTASGPVMDAKMMVDSESQPLLNAVLPGDAPVSISARASASRNVERFIATFRGRQMYGQAVDIPSGFGGLVLRAPSDLKGKGHEDPNKVKSRSKTRVTRRSKRATADDAEDEPEGGEGNSDGDLSLPTRKLVPLSTFNSFMLWTPDRPLDEGSDEYVRTLAEWTCLSAKIHSHDE